ncbi:MAG: arginine repressor [Oscillospiraceae bacterium]|nr:arginine repressor [Oscillospiraceae bacterium]
MKEIRQRAILDIIAQKDIETQFDLIRELNERGVKSTQATVSRDIKELRLYKELTGSDSYRYASPVADVPNNSEKLRTIFRESLTSCVCAENIVVIKTLPGLASAACSAIDKMDIEDMAGTIAGDDTAFIAMMSRESAKKLCRMIEENM